ncbi:bifunctional acetylxylan esterase/glucomannan deacetylase AxeC2 [Pseudoduganella namucuonensis]|uniref:GDSL-like Lipase/Acylhydrolase family protein n=1 Tax=Pseudoduganella namucuonensis TaxID=1035707 RepID=A0A1I7HQI8_9BURK|nr:bifunctional acetylxylan esterase/glucomannan deacetylase AxeC2 [Pseudoduganella namucuonensis]SFU62931.1 GDSL-like Lipase/Acylhydrolase family protein [Pseudoduganella namucuonensis]
MKPRRPYHAFAATLAGPLALAVAMATAAIVALQAPVAAAEAAEAASSLRMVRAADAPLYRMGRTADGNDGGVRLAYPGASLFLRFAGKTLAVDASSTGNPGYIEVQVDDQAPRLVALTPDTRRVELVRDAGGATHEVRIMQRTETWQGITRLAGFAHDGQLAAWPQPEQRKMLVLGDSVTCAQGIDRVSGDARSSSMTNPRASYGMLAAQALRAQVALVCYGGRGLVRTWEGKSELNLPEFYELAIPDPAAPAPWDHRRYDPDVVVSAIGTNDFTVGVPDRENYVGAYTSLVNTMLRNHPHAQIVLTEGAILNGEGKTAMRAFIAETAARVGSPRVHIMPSTHYPGDAEDAHPTREQHAAMARELAEHLRALLRW